MKNQTKQQINKKDSCSHFCHSKGYTICDVCMEAHITEPTKPTEYRCCDKGTYHECLNMPKLMPKPTESWEEEFIEKFVSEHKEYGKAWSEDFFAAHGKPEDLRRFIAKTLKEHDEKLVEEMEKEKKVSFSEVDVSQRIYNQAIDRAIEIVKSDE